MKLLSFALAWVLAVSAAPAQTRRDRKQSAPAAGEETRAPAPGSPWPVETVSVEGNHLYTADQILAVAGLRAGEIAGKAEFEAARDRLNATGAFDNVGYHFAPSPDGKGYDAAIEVTEVPQVYPLRFQDLPASDAELRAVFKKKFPLFGEKMPATKAMLDRYVAALSEFLAAKNYHEPVAAKPTSDATSDLVIVFRPAKARPNIARVKFTNAGDLPTGMLETAMFGVAVGIPYDEPEFRLLLDSQIRPIFEARGKIRVAFPKITTEPAKDVDGVDVTVQVEPGPVYTLEHVSFTGAEAPDEPFAKLANFKTNQAVDFDQVKAAQDRIAQSMHHSGYLQANSSVKRDIDDQNKKISIVIDVKPGPLFTLGKLEIVGLDIESEPVIRKMWTLQPGKPFNDSYPEHFLNRIKQGGVFDNLKTTRSETKINADHTVDVTLYFNK